MMTMLYNWSHLMSKMFIKLARLQLLFCYTLRIFHLNEVCFAEFSLQTNNLIKLMKQQSQEKHSQFLDDLTKGGQTAEFEIFKDEHFLKHKKKESKLVSSQPKVYLSPNVFELTQSKYQKKMNQASNTQKQIIHFRTQVKNIASMKFGSNCSQQLTPQKTKDETEQRAWRQSRLQRYDRNSSSEIKAWGEVKVDYQPKSNNQKIGILKRIIQHYNIKSMEKTFESNLINKQANSHSESSGKNKFVSVKKVVPKSAVRRQTATRSEFTAAKLKGYLNLQGMNLIENYFNPASIQVEAQSINQLIKGSNQVRSNKTTQSKKERIKKQKKPSIPGHISTKGHKFETLPAEKFKTLESLNDNCINIKINKFKEFIFMINFANKVYRELDIAKYTSNFKIFIGRGNNCNLIKAVMKRRFWFEITKNIEEANFVWTQLKEQSLYQKQNLIFQQKEQMTKKQALVQELINEEEKSCKREESVVITRHTATEQTQEQYSSLKVFGDKSIQYQIRQKKDLKTRKYRERNIPGNVPQRRILTKQQIQSQKQVMDEVQLRKRTSFNDRIRYLKGFRIVEIQQLKSQIVHNHIILNGLLGNKKAMFYMLRQYYKLIGRSVFQTVPLTFHIKKGFLDDQFKQFMTKFTQNKSNKAHNYWIIKPGEFSNRGQGITCTNKLEEIRSRIGSLRNMRNRSLILQQYLTRPLLYNGRKFDIRTYMLLTVNNCKLRGYWYQDGYIRTSSYTWSLQQIGDSYVHLTNDAIQKYSNSYGKYEPGNKLTYSELQRYLDSLPKNNEKDYNFQSQIYPKLKQIATDSIKSCFCFIDPSRKGNNFQIFGFDFMIDSDFKPWLIEINTNPCLQMSCPVLDRIIPSMVQNAFRIGLDPLIPPPLNYSSTYKYSIPQNALHYNKFQLIFDEDRDGAFLHDLYQGNNIVKQIDEYEQDKEIYEEQGQEITLDEN